MSNGDGNKTLLAEVKATWPELNVFERFEYIVSICAMAIISVIVVIALILLLLGTGPIRGFAITLGIGVVGSLFCALVASRMLLEKAGFAEFIPVRVSQTQDA